MNDPISLRPPPIRRYRAAAVASLQALFPAAAISAIPADLSTAAEVARFTAAVAASVDRVHILVANAGATWGAALEKHSDVAFQRVFDLNVKSVFNLIRDMVPLLEAAGSFEDPARVITVGSVAGIQIGGVGEAATFGYSASKAAVHHLTKNLAVALAPRGILVNAIAPGVFDTKMGRGLLLAPGSEEKAAKTTPNRRLGRPEDIAGIMVWLCSRAASHVNGAIIPVDGGFHLLPGGKL